MTNQSPVQPVAEARAVDLHIHSRFSRATSRELEPHPLARWAEIKGLAVIGTGDLTHPGWLEEIREKLVEDGRGLLRLADKSAPGGGVRFVLTGEIACIYKKNDRVRKVHLVVMMPNLGAAERFNERLGRIGNLLSDGRPILGLDAKSVLELVLETDPLAEMIPAHIWTPWFSALGSKSGFDSLEECFDELTPHVHAVETGLSSDPPMNWRVPCLDRFHLVSSSDAHSPANLAREATLIQGPMGYEPLLTALRTGQGLAGTLEFFPEEGKYHLDGHRKCAARLEPEDTRARGGLCPVCGKPVTVGVLSRVVDLAARPEDRDWSHGPATARPFQCLLPLAEVLSQVLGRGPKTKTVLGLYHQMIDRLGPEMDILRAAPLEDVARAGGEMTAEAIRRLRLGRVEALGGFDGQFGELKVFSAEERDEINRQGRLFAAPQRKKAAPKTAARRTAARPGPVGEGPKADPAPGGDFTLDQAQRAAVEAPAGPLSIVAGPGSGKTAVLTRRAASLAARSGRPDRVLAVTFTRKAAEQLGQRLAGMVDSASSAGAGIETTTFHALGNRLLTEWGAARPLMEDEDREGLIRELAKRFDLRPKRVGELISRARLGGKAPSGDCPPQLAQAYVEALDSAGVHDYDDLIIRPAAMTARDTRLAKDLAQRYDHVLVDEFQDLNPGQFAWLDLLTPEPDSSLTVVGDPDQAIYGFRGADPRFFGRLACARPGLGTVNLAASYRCPEPMIAAARGVIAANPGHHLQLSGKAPAESGPLILHGSFATPASEAVGLVREMEKLLGGSSHLSLETGAAEGRGGYGLADMAVLVRLHSQAELLAETLARAGLPCQVAADMPGRETDALEMGAEKISLLTIHAAKGLEFPVVFVAGFEAGLMPFTPADGRGADPAGERRLAYVALTRAQERLYLTRARKRTLHGRSLPGEPSPCLADIPGRLLGRLNDGPARPRRHIQPELF